MLQVLELGGWLDVAQGGGLRCLLPADRPPALKDAIRRHKHGLIEVLSGPPFLVVRSDVFPADVLFWTIDDDGRDLLIARGASAGSVYTREELELLVASRPDMGALAVLHRAKHVFEGRISAP